MYIPVELRVLYIIFKRLQTGIISEIFPSNENFVAVSQRVYHCIRGHPSIKDVQLTESVGGDFHSIVDKKVGDPVG